MATDQTNQPENSNPITLLGEPRSQVRRRLAVAAALVFLISSVFPLVAGLSHDTESFPQWWGPLDVGIAFVLAILVIVIQSLAHDQVTKQAEDASYRAYRVLIHGILAFCVVNILSGDRIVWPNCLTGLAWRTWLLLFSLPAWLTVWGAAIGLSRSPQK